MTTIDKQHINHLLNLMTKADKIYWSATGITHEIMTDDEYDTLYLQLKKYHQKYPNDQKINNYFGTMHHSKNNSFAKIRHPYHVISLDKIRTKPAIKHFFNKWSTNKKDLYYTDGFLIESKEDGLSFVIYFNDKRMPHKITALTRGSGVYGNDVTNEVYYFDQMDIKKIAKKIGNRHVVVRGEALISHKGFNEDNEASGNKFENERNLVSGTVMNKDPKTVGKRHVFLSAYSLLNRAEYKKSLPTELQQEKFLRNLGFSVTNNIHYFPNTSRGKKEALQYIWNYSHPQRVSVGHDTDGLVIKPNYTVNFSKIGWNTHSPLYANAYKYAPEQELTRVNKIKYQVSASGRLTPVIVFTHPVHLFGATIKKCTGSSLGNMKKNNIMINGYITVKRMNDVIPKAYGSKELNKGIKNLKSPASALPKDAVKKGKFYYIPKSNMANSLPVMINRWSKFVSKPCLNIMGLSDKMLATLIQRHLVDPHNFSSLWTMDKAKFLATPGFAEKGWNNLQDQLKKAKNRPLPQILLGLPIDNSGLSAFNPISKRIKNMKAILDDPQECNQMKQKLLKEIPNIKGLGQATVPIIKSLFSKPILCQLKALEPYLNMKDNQSNQTQKPASEQKLNGLRFCITGSLSKPRKVFTKIIKENGAKLQGTVNGKTDYLICNKPSNSSKYRKATKQNTKIINEDQFKKLLR